jgi:hypothetical protein
MELQPFFNKGEVTVFVTAFEEIPLSISLPDLEALDLRTKAGREAKRLHELADSLNKLSALAFELDKGSVKELFA